ncbi:polysaccharide lyase family 9 protein [Didymella exigua CBS 183.55]|uniref:Polysaccharide lyase family 9 protein n=1 Tax=Didymella exigua CBS 183.55 TaxID=1150837 RepID=A0A6A5RSP4_9PLEO|nr:polysaccharide lyase family 9 protein [Didymella exigua CBS 183.55]KAF1930463.1 polysaccharide lyase family 9 protein [Didymella exigua CBS 183.55]
MIAIQTLPCLLLALASLASAEDIYVSPKGRGSGSYNSPLGDIQKAVDAAESGDTIVLMGGIYAPSKNIQISTKCSASAKCTVRPNGTDKVVIDGKNMPGTPKKYKEDLPNKERGIFHVQNAQHWRFFDLELKNGPYGMYARDASNNHYERIVTHHNYETGFQLEGSSSNNVIVNLDSYRNADPRKNGKSADGFACKEGKGTGNVIRGARLYENSDDGLDLWEFESPLVIEDVVAWGNGYNRWDFSPHESDGNGIKLGGGSHPSAPFVNHIVRNVMSFQNLRRGFTDNNNPGSMTLERCTAFENDEFGFNFQLSKPIIKSSIAFGNKGAETKLKGGVKDSGNSWNKGGWSKNQFASTNSTTIKATRRSGGKLPATSFLRSADGSAIGADMQKV